MFKNKVDTYLRRADYIDVDEEMLDSRYGFLVHLPSGHLPWMAILLNLAKGL